MKKISIITTVYNRKEKLRELYSSLRKQTNHNFDWIIIDDGSEDDCYSEVLDWVNKGYLDIKSARTENCGKMHAYKTAVNMLDTEWSMVVDSDDYLGINAVELLYKSLNKIENNDSSLQRLGFIFPRNSATKIWDDINGKDVDIIDMKYLYGVKETAILINNSVLKMCFTDDLFYPKEKFLSEEVLYNKFIKYGKFKVLKDEIYFFEYLEDGMTTNIFTLWKKNPNGAIKLLNSRYICLSKYGLRNRFKNRVKTILNLNALCMKLKLSVFKNTPSKVYSFFLYLPAIIIKKLRFK